MAKLSRAELTYQKQVAELRVKIAVLLKWQSIPDALWEKFEGGISQVLEASDLQEREVYEEKLVRGLKTGRALAVQILEKGIPPGRSCNAVPQYQPTPVERDREAAIRNYYSGKLSQLPEVQHFRELLGHLMQPERVWSFLTSPLNQMFSFDELKAWDIDPHGAEGEIVDDKVIEDEGSGCRRQVTVLIQPGGVKKSVTHDPMKLLVLMSNKLLGDAQFLLDTYIMRPEQRTFFLASHFSPFPISHGQSSEIIGYEGTIVGEALRLSDDIAVRHQLEARSALLFLLTGQMPAANPVQTVLVPRPSYGLDAEAEQATWGPIALVVQPWVSGVALQQHYRVLQYDMFGKDNCPIKEMSLVLFNFVNKNWGEVSGKNKTQKWEKLLELWRETSQGTPLQTAYSDTFDWRNLRATYHRVKKALLPPLS